MRIYVAGTFGDQRDLRSKAAVLWELGHEVTGSWLNEVARPEHMPKDIFWRKLAIKDACEIFKADMIIQDNRQSSGGKNCEWGIGIGQFQAKQLWLVGESTNVFQELADYKFNTWDELFSFIKATYPTAKEQLS